MFSGDSSKKYDLLDFANLRGYVVSDELIGITKKCVQIKLKKQKQKDEEFIAKFGPKSQWSEDILLNYENDDLDS